MDSAPARKKQKGEEVREPEQAFSPGSRNVEVFLTSWCGYCKKMIAFLKEKGIPYTAYDVEKDSSAERIYRQLGGNGVPLVRIGTHLIHGFNPQAVLSHLKE